MAVCGRCWVCNRKFECGSGIRCESCGEGGVDADGPPAIVYVDGKTHKVCRDCVTDIDSGVLTAVVDALRTAAERRSSGPVGGS